MAVFRVEKSRDYVVMAKHHLREKDISLKSKGLLSLILSLPEDWNYSTRGLASICKEGVDSIGSALRELENAGYLVRNKLRDGKGRITDTEYIIYEFPQKPDTPPPCTGNPYPVNPRPTKPRPGNSELLNIDIPNTKKVIPDLSSIHQSITTDRDAMITIDSMDIYREIIRDNIEYEYLYQQYDPGALDEIVELMTETACVTKKTIRISGEDKPSKLVKSCMLKIDRSHIEYVLDCMDENTTDVRNIKSYLLTAIYNAPMTMQNYYKSRVNRDLYGES